MPALRTVLALGLAATALALAGCGGDDNAGSSDTTVTDTTAATDTTGTDTTEATETTGTDTTEATDTTGTDTTEASGTKIVGTVGTADDGEAFTITLTNADGSDVTSLAAGHYTLEIKDLATIHNFHLTGPGDVDVTSEVDQTEDENYDVTLQAGTYNFVCDPHADSMSGSFEVTG